MKIAIHDDIDASHSATIMFDERKNILYLYANTVNGIRFGHATCDALIAELKVFSQKMKDEENAKSNINSKATNKTQNAQS